MVNKINQVKGLEQKYRKFFENMGEGVCILDGNMVVTFVNDRLCKAWGYSRGELLGSEICSFLKV